MTNNDKKEYNGMRYELPSNDKDTRLVEKIVMVHYKGCESVRYNIGKFNKAVLYPSKTNYTKENYENTSNAIFMLLNKYLATLDGSEDALIRDINMSIIKHLQTSDVNKPTKSVRKARSIGGRGKGAIHKVLTLEEKTKRHHIFCEEYKRLCSTLMETETYNIDNVIEFIIAYDLKIPKTYSRGEKVNSKHTKEQTYFKDEVIELMAFVIVLKLMMIVTSSFIEYISNDYDKAPLRLETAKYMPDALLKSKQAIRLQQHLSILATRKPIPNKLQMDHSVSSQNIQGWLFAESVTYRLQTSRCGIDTSNVVAYLHRHVTSKLDSAAGDIKDKNIGSESRVMDETATISDEYRCKYDMSVAEQRMLVMHTRPEYLLPVIDRVFPDDIEVTLDAFSEHPYDITDLQRAMIQITLYRYLPEDAYWLAGEKDVKSMQYISYWLLKDSHPIIATLIIARPIKDPPMGRNQSNSLSKEVKLLKAECLSTYNYAREKNSTARIDNVVEELVKEQIDKACVMEVYLPKDAPVVIKERLPITDEGYLDFKPLIRQALYEFYNNLDQI
jgi:hypothetical protein